MQTASVALLVLLVLPLAGAQVPPSIVPCGPIAIPAAPAAPAPVTPGAQASIVVDVENNGNVPATITVTASADAGWAIVSSPAPTNVPQQGVQSFTVVVEAATDATRAGTITFSASGTCDTPLGTNCPQAACVAASVNTQVVVPLRADEGFRFPGLGSLDLDPEYLIAGILLVGIATAIPLAMRKKRGGIVAECPEPLKMVKPGRGTSFPIELRNAAKEPVSAQFEVGPVPEGWSAFMPLPEVQLAAREARSLWLMVRSPQNAAQGDAVDVELRLRDATGKDARVVRVRAEVQGTAEA